MNIEQAKQPYPDEPFEVPELGEVPVTPEKEPGGVPGAVIEQTPIPEGEDEDEQITDSIDKHPPKNWDPKNFQ